MDPRVAQVIAHMERRLHTRLDIAELAAAVELSPSRLGRLFRDGTGLTPLRYLHQLRMRRARLLIERTSLSIGDVMAQVGIADPSHFSRDFRRAHGFSPRTLRRQLRLAGPPARYLAADTWLG